VSKHLAKV